MDPIDRKRYLLNATKHQSVQLTNIDVANPRWRLACNSLKDWQILAEKLAGSSMKCERHLHSALVNEFLGELPALFDIKVGFKGCVKGLSIGANLGNCARFL